MQEMKKVKIKDLKPYENNAKIHSDYQIGLLVKSIEEFGFINPVLIDEDNNVLAGHGRIEAAKRLKIKELPAITIEGMTEIEKQAYILADNRLSELAMWDNRIIAQELKDLEESDFDTDVTGFSVEDIDFSFLDEDEEPENDEDEKGMRGGQICECPRCKCIFNKTEIITHGNEYVEKPN